MNTGDYVTAAPASEYLRDTFPTVTGTLEITKSDFMGEQWDVFTVNAQYEDGSACPVEVLEDQIRAASPRRTDVTVLPNPE